MGGLPIPAYWKSKIRTSKGTATNWLESRILRGVSHAAARAAGQNSGAEAA
jgi:hypothetical protein